MDFEFIREQTPLYIEAAKLTLHMAVIGVILLVVAGLLGLSLAMIHVVTGAYEKMTAYFFLIYHVILTVVTALAVRLR